MCSGKILGLFYMYGLMIAIGMLACFGVLYFYGKKKNIESKFIDFIFFNAVIAIALGWGSATLFQATYNYIAHPENGFNLGTGFTFIGGLIGGVISFLVGYFLFRKRYKNKLIDIVSMAPCCILVAHGFGRIGCFCAGCCYGKPTDSFLGVQFPHLPEPVHPTQLYEAGFLFLLFAILFLLLMKKNFRHNLSVYLIAYGIFRFCIEYLRADSRGELLPGISPSQFWSILMVVAGVGVYFMLNYFYKKRDRELLGERDEEIKTESEV